MYIFNVNHMLHLMKHINQIFGVSKCYTKETGLAWGAWRRFTSHAMPFLKRFYKISACMLVFCLVCLCVFFSGVSHSTSQTSSIEASDYLTVVTFWIYFASVSSNSMPTEQCSSAAWKEMDGICGWDGTQTPTEDKSQMLVGVLVFLSSVKGVQKASSVLTD